MSTVVSGGKAVVGYFVWMRTLKGPPAPKKYDAQLATVTKDTTEYYLRNTLTNPPIPLNEEEWQLSLDELAKRYPAPTVRS